MISNILNYFKKLIYFIKLQKNIFLPVINTTKKTFKNYLFNKKQTFQRVFRLVTDKKNKNKKVNITLIMLKISKYHKLNLML